MKWHNGKPPSIGWWPASICQQKHVLRWWNGERWSYGVPSHWNSLQAGIHAAKKEVSNKGIQWAKRWWL